jgi:hypothetical protein
MFAGRVVILWGGDKVFDANLAETFIDQYEWADAPL